MRFATLALLLLASIAAAAEPGKKPDAAPESRGAIVVCTIRSTTEDSPAPHVVFDGPCRFLPDGKGGSFRLSALDEEAPLCAGVLEVTVSVVAPGKAEVRGLTSEGINSRWGEARRSKKDLACWTGSDFEICARKG